MNRFKIVFFMMAALICIAATSWGSGISLNNNNYLIEAAQDYQGNINFRMGTITDTDEPQKFFSESLIHEFNWGYSPAISLNDNNTFIEANLGMSGTLGAGRIYYNAGKVDPVTHQITFTDTGFSFNNNDGQAPTIYLNNNNNFIEVHKGTGTLDHRIVPTKKFPFFKRVPMSNLYYVTGKIDNDGKIIYLNTGKYCGYGEFPIITTTDDNIFTEIHAGPDSGSPYSIIGNIDNEGNFLSKSGEGIEAVAGHELKNQTPLAVKMTNIKGTKDYNVNLLTSGLPGFFSGTSYFHILNGSLPNDGQIVWNSCVDITVVGSQVDAWVAANDKYFVYLLNQDSYKVIPYNSSGNW